MNTPNIHPLSRCLSTVASSMLLTQLCAAQYVELTAKIETVRWNREGISRTEPWEVRCIVGTNTWQMEGIFLEGAKSAAWFTGKNIILNNELSQPVGENQHLVDYAEGPNRFVQVATSSGQRWTRNSESGDGNPGRAVRQPDLLTLDGRIAWLAFCSGQCLKREGRRVYPPSDLWKELVSAPGGFSDRTVTFEDELGLPKSLRLQATNGFPVLQYGVVNSTNVCGWEFPQEFYLVQYRPALPYDSNRIAPEGWEVDFIAKGTVVTIGPSPKPEIPSEVLAVIKK